MKILVTGGTGFIGSNLVKALLSRGDEVVITGHDAEQKLPDFKGKYLQPSFIGLDWDAIGKIDVLFHQAAINDITLLDERELFRANVDASIELFRYVVQNGCRKIVYASSTAVYGNIPVPHKESGPTDPLNPYAKSKKRLDELAMEFAGRHPHVTVVGLRYCNVYGPGENHKGKRASMIYQLAQQMKSGNPQLFKYGEQKRDYLYVADAVRANLLAAETEESAIFNCGFGKAVTFNEIVRILNRVLGLYRVPEYIENPFKDQYQSYTECDMTLAREKLGFMAEFDIEKGIRRYLESGYLA